MKVEPTLTVPGHEEVFVIGDLASLVQDGKPVPGVAPAAMQMGRYVGEEPPPPAEGTAAGALPLP